MAIEAGREVEILVNDVSMVFSGKDRGVTALANIHFEVYKNEFISLLGPSGCGKSTLLRLMADLLQPTSGEIRIQNKDTKEARLTRQYGIVFQSPTLFEWRTVRENIDFHWRFWESPRKNGCKPACDCLSLLDYPRLKIIIHGS